MRFDTVRIVASSVLVVLMAVVTLRTLTGLWGLLVERGPSAYVLGASLRTLLPALALVLAIRSLRRGLARRRIWIAARRALAETPEQRAKRWAAEEEALYERFPVTWDDKEIDLQRDYPIEGDWWTAQPLDEERVATWLVEHGFSLRAGGAITPELLRDGEPDPMGSHRSFDHVDPAVQGFAGIHDGRLRSLGFELHTEDRATRVRLVAAMHRLAAAHSTVLHSER